MTKIALFVGDLQTLYNLEAFECLFMAEGFQTAWATTFEGAIEVMEKQNVSIVIFYAYGDTLSKPIDSYQGKLPPAIYWYMPSVDERPKKSGIRCVDCYILPSQMMKIAKGILHLQ